MKRSVFFLLLVAASLTGLLRAEVCNVKVVTDASPDYSDMPSLVHSVCSKWKTDKEKCWAMFYWVHIARRQTAPMELHGLEHTDPIRQFNDYGFTMCSTVSGLNNAIWEHMGLRHKFWDVKLHTVCEVEYDGRWHMYDSSLSAMYTLCDGTTIAGVQDLGKTLACAASGGVEEPSHIVKYHCVNATSPKGFIEGADGIRNLATDDHFLPDVLKYRSYYYNWDYGHRYILNLKDGEVYTRFYHRLDDPKTLDTRYFVPNPPHQWEKPTDPEAFHAEYRIRGNGIWTFKPALNADFAKVAHSASNIAAAEGSGLQPAKAGAASQVIYKIQSANVTTAMTIDANLALKHAEDSAVISISTDNGLHWQEVFKSDKAGELPAKIALNREVSCTYETLIKIALNAKAAPGDAVLKSLNVQTITEVNSKTQPKLNLGKNTVYVGVGDQTDSIVFWPELQRQQYKQHIVEEKNIKAEDKHSGYTAVLKCANNLQEAYLVYRMDAPRDITQITYGGRFHNQGRAAHCDLLHSFDEGKTWTKSWSLTVTEEPYDRIHYETVKAPPGVRSVLFKYSLNNSGLYAVRMEANHLPADSAFKPIEITYTWNEVQKDRTRVKRSHAQLVEKVPFKYTLNVGGEDHPVMDSICLNLKGSRPDVKYGYSDDKDVGGEKFVGKWVTYGKNLAVGKTYTVSVRADDIKGGTDPANKKLTDGIVGSAYADGKSWGVGGTWRENRNPLITLDLGEAKACASLGLHIQGYPLGCALRGDVKETIEVLVSEDGKEYKSLGFTKTSLFWKELPANFFWPHEETMCAFTARLIPQQPVTTRYVQYKVTSGRIFGITELEVLDSLKYEPFDLRLALPDEKPAAK